MNFQTIARCTKDCPREDCAIIDLGGASTCMGWTPTYDKHGNRTDRGDPNIHSNGLKCTTCGASWFASTQYGKTTITARDVPQSQASVGSPQETANRTPRD